MAEFARVATFEADDAALDALLDRINADDGAPEGVPATRITVLADRAAGKVVIAVRFGSEEDLRKGAETLEGHDAAGRRQHPPHLGRILRSRARATRRLIALDVSAAGAENGPAPVRFRGAGPDPRFASPPSPPVGPAFLRR